MKKRELQTDPLADLFLRARSAEVADDGFTRRVLGRLEPLPPSRNYYRVPTFATALASVLVIVWVAFSGIHVVDFTERLARHEQKSGVGVRLVPQSWWIQHAEFQNTGDENK